MSVFEVGFVGVDCASDDGDDGCLDGRHSVQVVDAARVVQRNLLGQEGLKLNTVSFLSFHGRRQKETEKFNHCVPANITWLRSRLSNLTVLDLQARIARHKVKIRTF